MASVRRNPTQSITPPGEDALIPQDARARRPRRVPADYSASAAGSQR